MEEEILDKIKKLGYNNIPRKNNFHFSSASNEEVMQIMSYLFALYEPSMVFADKSSVQVASKNMLKYLRIMDLSYKFNTNEPLKQRNKFVSTISSMIDRLESKYGDIVYTSQRPRIASTRFNFQDKENNTESKNLPIEKIENEIKKEEKVVEKVVVKPVEKVSTKPVVKPVQPNKRRSLAPVLETIEESNMEYSPKKVVKKPIVQKKPSEFVSSDYSDMSSMSGLSTGRQLMRTPPRSETNNAHLKNTPYEHSSPEVESRPVVSEPEQDVVRPVEIIKTVLKKKDKELIKEPESPFLTLKTPKFARTPVNTVKTSPKIVSKSKFELSEDLEDTAADSNASTIANSKEAKDERWLSKATRARMASKTARALEVILLADQENELSDSEFDKKVKKLSKKVKTPAKSTKKKKSRSSIGPETTTIAAPLVAPIAVMPLNLALPTAMSMPAVTPTPTVTAEEAAKWVTLSSQLPIPSQMFLHGIFHQISVAGKTADECNISMYTMMQAYFPFLFTLQSSTLAAVSKEVTLPSLPTPAAVVETVPGPLPSVVEAVCEELKTISIQSVEPIVLSTPVKKSPLKQVSESAASYKTPLKFDTIEDDVKMDVHIIDEMQISPPKSVPIKNIPSPVDDSFKGRVTRLGLKKKQESTDYLKQLKNEIESIRTSTLPLKLADKRLVSELNNVDQDLLLLNCAIDEISNKNVKSSFQDKLNSFLKSRSNACTPDQISELSRQLLLQYNLVKAELTANKLKVSSSLETVDKRFKEIQRKCDDDAYSRRMDFESLRSYNQKLAKSENLLNPNRPKSPAKSPARIMPEDPHAESKQSLRRMQLFIERRKSIGTN